MAGMDKKSHPLRNSFLSALIGGVVVAAVGLLAIGSGWIEVGNSESSAPAISMTRPAADTSGGQGKTIGQIYAEDGRGVAFIQSQADAPEQDSPFGVPGGPGGPGGASAGSGFVVDNAGRILTNQHVVDGADEIEVRIGDSDTIYEAEVIGEDPATDLALIQVDAPADALFPLEFADSDGVRVGDPVVAIGNPFGLDRSVTSGIVSAVQRQIQAPNGFSISNVIQTDAPINPGNSGGPLIDSDGRVVGVNSQIQTGGLSGGNVGIGFAVPINTAREVIDQLETTGTVEHAYMGVTGATVDSQMAEALNLPVEAGVMIQEVTEDGPADKAGLEGGDTAASLDGINVRLGGDIIVEADGEPVQAMDEVISLVNEASPGDRMRLSVVRGDGERQVTVTLGERPETAG